MAGRITLIVHGGAGRRERSARSEASEGGRREGLRTSIDAGWSALTSGRGVLDAVEAAVRVLEDHGGFNAGRGSVLTLAGERETDASVMTGDGRFGAVGAAVGVRNPVSLARRVMEETDHLILCGDGARRAAAWFGLEPDGPIDKEQRKKWEKLMRDVGGDECVNAKTWKRLRGLLKSRGWPSGWSNDLGDPGTVGAVARDSEGRIAVATSTGGIWLKLPGRVGDSALPGAGTYAAGEGGVSATGHGEGIMRLALARRAVEAMSRLGAPEAMQKMTEAAGSAGCPCGLIGIDTHGEIGSAMNTESMMIDQRSEEG